MEMIGKKFGRMTVLKSAPSRGYRMFLCRCDCGAEKEAIGTHLVRGLIVSCGCAKRERIKQLNLRTGESRTKAHEVWWNMRSRCEWPKHKYFARYGGRGIKVCDRWHDFANFLEDMGQPPPGHRLERLDNDGEYAPWNCVWVDAQAQANNRSSNRVVEFDGKTMTLAEWGRDTGLGRTLEARLRHGWSVERALTEPLRRW